MAQRSASQLIRLFLTTGQHLQAAQKTELCPFRQHNWICVLPINSGLGSICRPVRTQGTCCECQVYTLNINAWYGQEPSAYFTEPPAEMRAIPPSLKERHMVNTRWILHVTHGTFKDTPGRHFINHWFTDHVIIINSIFSLLFIFFNEEGSVGAKTYLTLKHFGGNLAGPQNPARSE